MVISQTVQAYVHSIHPLETPPSVIENSARGMLVQDLMPSLLSFWPFFFGHCLLSLFLLSCQVSTRQGERHAHARTRGYRLDSKAKRGILIYRAAGLCINAAPFLILHVCLHRMLVGGQQSQGSTWV